MRDPAIIDANVWLAVLLQKEMKDKEKRCVPASLT